MVTFTEDDILRIGTECGVFLQGESFAKLVEYIKIDCYNQFLQSQPEEKRKREDLFLFNGALDSVVAVLQNFAQSAESLRVQREEG